VKPQPLTDAEFERLSGVLGRFDNKHPMNLEQLDGFWSLLGALRRPRLQSELHDCRTEKTANFSTVLSKAQYCDLTLLACNIAFLRVMGRNGERPWIVRKSFWASIA
jgi:hypothetical protein